MLTPLTHRPVRQSAGIVCALLLCLPGCATYDAVSVNDVRPEYLAAPSRAVKTLDLTKLARPTESQSRLQPGDVLQITCSNLFEESTREKKESETFPVRIAPDGTVTLPLLNEGVSVSSLTVGEAEQAMRNAYRTAQLINRPQLTAKVLEYKKNKIYVIGAVKKPGMYQLRPDHSDPLRAIAAAEGVSPEAGTVVEIRRADKEVSEKPASAAVPSTGTAEVAWRSVKEPSPTLVPATVFVEPVKRSAPNNGTHGGGASYGAFGFYGHNFYGAYPRDYNVYSSSQEASPTAGPVRVYSYSREALPTTELVLVGHDVPEEAVSSRSANSEKPGLDENIIRFDLASDDIRLRPDQLQLQNGDIVSVEQKKMKPIFVSGSVNKPGEFPIPLGRELRVLEAIGMAGGVLAASEPNNALLSRRPDGKAPIVIHIELDRAARIPQENLALMEGDVITVVEDAASHRRRAIRQFLRLGFTPIVN
jgi:protein involved in polysaccharide export with SLBB domain